MKLYATTTSERATKEQGGNKFIQTNFTIDRQHVISITIKNREDFGTYEVWQTLAKEEPKLIKVISKGKQKLCDCNMSKEYAHTYNPNHKGKQKKDEKNFNDTIYRNVHKL